MQYIIFCIVCLINSLVWPAARVVCCHFKIIQCSMSTVLDTNPSYNIILCEQFHRFSKYSSYSIGYLCNKKKLPYNGNLHLTPMQFSSCTQTVFMLHLDSFHLTPRQFSSYTQTVFQHITDVCLCVGIIAKYLQSLQKQTDYINLKYQPTNQNGHFS